jgi:hypothetical protein
MSNIDIERLAAMIKEYSQLVKKFSVESHTQPSRTLQTNISHFQQTIQTELNELKSSKEHVSIYIKFKQDFSTISERYTLSKANLAESTEISCPTDPTSRDEEIKQQEAKPYDHDIPELKYLGNFDSIAAQERNLMIQDIENTIIEIKQIHEEIPKDIVYQGIQLDITESNTYQAAVEASRAVTNLEDARALQMKYLCRVGCLCVIFCGVVVGIAVPVCLVYIN